MTENRFYVYELVDPRDGVVFYIGKGSRYRAWQHEADVLNGRPAYNHGKSERIADIIASGQATSVRIVATYDDEAEAYSHEAELIAITSGLTNMLAGGTGSWSLTKEEAQRRLDLRPARLARARAMKTRKWLAEWLAMADRWDGLTVSGLAHGDQLGSDFIRLVRELVSAPLPEPIKY